jgi:hypothetical protein
VVPFTLPKLPFQRLAFAFWRDGLATIFAASDFAISGKTWVD